MQKMSSSVSLGGNFIFLFTDWGRYSKVAFFICGSFKRFLICVLAGCVLVTRKPMPYLSLSLIECKIYRMQL